MTPTEQKSERMREMKELNIANLTDAEKARVLEGLVTWLNARRERFADKQLHYENGVDAFIDAAEAHGRKRSLWNCPNAEFLDVVRQWEGVCGEATGYFWVNDAIEHLASGYEEVA
jgi:hypothetical protein